ncbi:hypothetical protein [Halocella sp. SP3-1]|uniref:hypothetical protein n=1 Tax=Halocella sp. SP3-1 TaxID=2382161 RepID=UPI000F7644F9|nr:hypothetical protein [Halocella sp. SP3-1]AZO96114.1 hypothetical protein D7D81_16790 [Halocella sp. SP3-1]
MEMYIPGRILGILWTTASWSSTENIIILTNCTKDILVEVSNFLIECKINYTIYRASPEKKRPDYEYDYYRMKISNQKFIELLREQYKWRGQREGKRYYPAIETEQQEIEFLKYYIADQGTLDKMKVSWGKGWIYRYRIYCSRDFIDQLNSRISAILGVKENKPQNHSQSDSTKILYYQSQKDVNIILDFINQS